jgi:hypothetical protein
MARNSTMEVEERNLPEEDRRRKVSILNMEWGEKE